MTEDTTPVDEPEDPEDEEGPLPRFALIAPCVLTIIALTQIITTTQLPLTSWKGGGFGMFAAAEPSGSRFVRATGIADEDFVTVGNVVALSEAARLGLLHGDRIKSYDGKSIRSSAELEAAVKAAESSGKPTVPMVVIRSGTEKTYAFKPGPLGIRPRSRKIHVKLEFVENGRVLPKKIRNRARCLPNAYDLRFVAKRCLTMELVPNRTGSTHTFRIITEKDLRVPKERRLYLRQVTVQCWVRRLNLKEQKIVVSKIGPEVTMTKADLKKLGVSRVKGKE